MGRIKRVREFGDPDYIRIDQAVFKFNCCEDAVRSIARPSADGGYEMVSGHRRMHAAKLAGLKTIPAVVKEMDDDTAVVAMVDSNVQREEILPSERAFSFKMKYDVLKKQGKRNDLTCGTEFHKSEDDEDLDAIYEDEVTCGTEFHKLEPENKKARDTVGKEAGIVCPSLT